MNLWDLTQQIKYFNTMTRDHLQMFWLSDDKVCTGKWPGNWTCLLQNQWPVHGCFVQKVYQNISMGTKKNEPSTWRACLFMSVLILILKNVIYMFFLKRSDQQTIQAPIAGSKQLQDHPELKKGEEHYWLHHSGWLNSITFGQQAARLSI